MDPLTTRSQPDSAQRNPQAQNIRPQNISNINKPLVQPSPNYPPQQQNYRLPTAGQPIPQGQPVIRAAPVNPGVRPINLQQQPPPIRALPPNGNQPPIRPPIIANQLPFRPTLPQQPPFQRPNFPAPGPPLDPQFRPQQPPVNLQRQPFPEQKIIRNQPPNMTEISRERTFTTSNEVSADDDDDVVVGRMTTPQTRPNVKPVENYAAPPQSQPPVQRPPQQQQPNLQRRESKESIPSRPPSGLGSNNSQSPEPRVNQPQVGFNVQPQQQQQPLLRMDSNRSNSNEVSRQSQNNYENTRDVVENGDNKGQRSVNNIQQRQSPEGNVPRPLVNQQPQRPPSQNEPRQIQKPEIPNPSAMKSQDQTKVVENQNRKNAVRLDLSDSNIKDKSKSPSKGDNDSGVDENFQEKNGNSPNSPLKSPSKIPSYQPRPASITPKTRSRSTSKQRLSLRVSPESEQPEPLIKKIPMNKIEVGNAPSPNLKKVQSKIGSLQNATHKPGGGNVKIESRKVEIKAAPRIEAKNDAYQPRGGDKKILSQKLTWNAKSKIGSLENATHKPGGGDKKILEVKTDFKERARSKVGSRDNMGHTPGGGDVKIVTQKIDVKAESKVGSLDNVGHKPKGGDKKIFDDKEYLKQIEHPIPISPQPQMITRRIIRIKIQTKK